MGHAGVAAAISVRHNPGQMARTYKHRAAPPGSGSRRWWGPRPKGKAAAARRALREQDRRTLRGERPRSIGGYRDAMDFDTSARRSDLRRLASTMEWQDEGPQG